MPREVKGLSGAIEIAAFSKALLRHVQKKCSSIFLDEGEEFCGRSLTKGDFAIAPMLLALSTELALKAWIVREGGQQSTPRTHDLLKLFRLLSPAKRERLSTRFAAEVLPDHRSWLELDDDLESALERISNAFVEWRYLHEQYSANFETSKIERIIELMLDEFESTIHVRKVTPPVRPTFGRS